MPRIKFETLLAQRVVDRAAEGHELRFDARKLRERAHGKEHFLEKAAADIGLGEAGGNVEAADQSFLLLENIKGITGGGAIFKCDAAAERVCFQKTFDEVERAAIVPVQLVVPVSRFFLEQRLKLADAGLAKVEDIHGRRGAQQDFE